MTFLLIAFSRPPSFTSDAATERISHVYAVKALARNDNYVITLEALMARVIPPL